MLGPATKRGEDSTFRLLLNRPNDSFADLALVMDADNSPLRLSSYTIAERKEEQGTAAVYMYYFRWRSPVLDGKLRSMHCMEIPFIFDHVDDLQIMTGMGRDRYELANQMSEAWVSFARTGNPSHAGLGEWPAFRVSERATMVFDTESRVVNDPFGERAAGNADVAGTESAGVGRLKDSGFRTRVPECKVTVNHLPGR